MKCFIIVISPTVDGLDVQEYHELATRKQFKSYKEAWDYTSFYAESVRDRVIIVECHLGLTY
jgi:hypothetical protein